MTSEALERSDNHRVARRNVAVLSIGQALYGVHAVAFMTVGSLVGNALAEDKSLATLPITAFMVGTALTTVPASLLMRRAGRRFGFLVGATCAGLSGLAGLYAIYAQSFWWFLVCGFLTGSYQAISLYYRFAATDRASEAFKARAISWVLLGGVVSAFIAPQIIIRTEGMFAAAQFAGTFAALALLAALAAAVVSFVDIPVLTAEQRSGGRPLRRIASRPRFIVAVVCGTVGYAAMNFVMTASPLAMIGHNHSLADAAIAIQWHAVAMFAPSFFTGNIIDRFGKTRVIFAGMVILALSGVVALGGVALWHFYVSLSLLGLGWNFSFVAATAMVTDCHSPEETNKVQALNDLVIFTTVALGSFSAGKVFHRLGWDSINWVLFPLVSICVVLLVWLVMVEKRKAATGTAAT